MAYRLTAVVLSGLVAAGDAFAPGKCDDASPESNSCCDVTQENNAKCVKHVNWAMGDGVGRHPHWYSIYDVEKGDTFANFQCALFYIAYNKAQAAVEKGFPSEHHACARPCTATVMNKCANPPGAKPAPVIAAPAFKKASFKKAACPDVTACPCGTEDGTVQCTAGEVGCDEANTCPICIAECPSLDTWMIVLIVLALIAVAIALAYFLCNEKKEKSKKPKKRALKAAPERVEPVAQPVAQPPSVTMVQALPPTTAIAPKQYVDEVRHSIVQQPVQTMVMQQPVQTMVQTYAAPVPTYAQPIQTMVSQPMQMQQQTVQMVSQPMQMQYATQGIQQPVNMFNALDTNGDGVLSQAEMSRMGQFQQPQVMHR